MATGDHRVLIEEHVEQWRRRGYTVLEHFLAPTELAAAWADLRAFLPTRAQYAAAPEFYRNDPGGGYSRELPFLGDAVNAVAVHPGLISFVERALGTRNLS